MLAWTQKNVGNSNVSYGTVAMLVVVVMMTMILINLAFRTAAKVA